ncbi:hypothetical protein BUC_5338 [Burkholderia pseudomallei 576]|nr:hypothetical protein BUC_5338 [Burkholderia pseudomallei 576]
MHERDAAVARRNNERANRRDTPGVDPCAAHGAQRPPARAAGPSAEPGIQAAPRTFGDRAAARHGARGEHARRRRAQAAPARIAPRRSGKARSTERARTRR